MKKLLTAIAALLPAFSLAQRTVYGENITITRPVQEDLYVAGSRVAINAPVYGDLLAAGGYVTLNDTVSQDIHVVGGEVTLNGYAGDDVRCAGGKLYINQQVAGDLVVTGGTVTVASNAVIAGNIMASGGTVIIDGEVKGNVKAAGGKMEINGSVAKALDCRGGELAVNGTVAGPGILAAQHITIGSGAGFGQGVRYWNKEGAVDFGPSVKQGAAVFDASLAQETPRWHYLGFATLLGVLWYLGTAFLFILLIQYLFGPTMQQAAATLAGSRARAAGYGLLFLLLVPVGVVIACMTLVGIPLGILLFIAYLTLLLAATVITAVVLANWINNRYAKQWKMWKLVWVALGIFILLKLISLTPLVGWLVVLVAVCLAFGAILININWRKKEVEASKVF